MKQFLITLAAIFVSVLIFILFTSIIVFFSVRETPPKVDDGAMLVLNLNQPISDRAQPGFDFSNVPDLLISGAPSATFTLRELMAVIDHAAEDDRISGIYLTGNVPTGGTFFSGSATLRELRESLERFRETGKKIYAYEEGYNMRSYYLASLADSVFMHPFGTMGTRGYSTTRMFYKGAMEKFGFKMNLVSVGDYKSAPEVWYRTDMSAEDQEQRLALMDGHFGQFSADVAASRGVTVDAVHDLVENIDRFTDNQMLVEAGFIDKVTYIDEVFDFLREFTGEDDRTKPFRQVSYSNYRENVKDKLFPKKGDQIALLYAEGAIVGGSGLPDVAGDRFGRTLRQIRTDDDIKAVVIRVNSPGGGVTPSEIILREMRLLVEEKPVVVTMGNVAASGGYWISSFADHIYANPTTVTGSIGVFGMFPVLDELVGEYGFAYDGVKSHTFANLRTDSRSPTARETALINAGINKVYDQFLERVAEGRELEMDAAHEVSQGRVWTGTAALENGLIDELGGLNDALAKAAELAELEEWQVKTYERAPGFQARLLQQFGTRSAEADIYTDSAHPSLADQYLTSLAQLMKFFSELDDPNGMYVRLAPGFYIE